jgi:hypothetical protein
MRKIAPNMKHRKDQGLETFFFPFNVDTAMAEPLLENDLGELIIDEIQHIVFDNDMIIPWKAHRPKKALIRHVIENATDEISAALWEVICDKRGEQRYKSHNMKKRRNEQQNTRRVSARLEKETSERLDQQEEGSFWETLSMEEIKDCYRNFYEVTSNEALEMVVCGVCAREVMKRDGNVRQILLGDIPNSHRLIPKSPHNSHTLFDGHLLEP